MSDIRLYFAKKSSKIVEIPPAYLHSGSGSTFSFFIAEHFSLFKCSRNATKTDCAFIIDILGAKLLTNVIASFRVTLVRNGRCSVFYSVQEGH